VDVVVSDGTAKTSAAAAAVVAYFATVTFTVKLVAAIADSEISLEDILATHASCGDPAVFIRALLDVIPNLTRVCALRISNFISAKPAAASAAIATGLATFGTAIHTAAAAPGVATSAVTAAASRAFQAYEDDSGTSDILRDLFMFGPEMLSWGALDDRVASRIRSNKLSSGGEWKSHITSQADFQSFFADCTTHLLQQGHPGHVTRIQQWYAKIPPWGRGGKQYVVKYMRKHHAYLPTRLDMELVQESVAAAMVEMDAHIQSLDVMVDSARELKELRQQVSALTAGGGSVVMSSSGSAGTSVSNASTVRSLPRCNKCWVIGHISPDCKLSVKEAKKSKDRVSAEQDRLEAEYRVKSSPAPSVVSTVSPSDSVSQIDA
jgi:hypothetical protein